MKNHRYDYLPIIRRKELKWPNGARVAFCVYPNIECFHIDKPISGGSHLPDVGSYSERDYGSRVGVFRVMDVLDKHGLRASVMLNSDVCENQPIIIDEGKKRNWEWLGHGMSNHQTMADYPLEEERNIIRQVKETIAAAVGRAPRGWLGPTGAETVNTPDHLAAEGFDYLCDWRCDDQPIPMRVKTGRMLAMPYNQGVSDRQLFLFRSYSPDQYVRTVCDQFDTLYEEGMKGGRVMGLGMHPFIIGLAYRIRALDRALQYICSHKDVWCATASEIADWYYQHYYEDPGRP